MVWTNLVDIIILLETHISDVVADERVEAIGRSVGISILWDESYTSITIMSKQDHFIRFKVIKGKCVFRFIFLYALDVSSVDIIIILETHISDVVADDRVEAIGPSDGISILWDESYTSVMIMSKQDHFIRFKAIKGKCVFRFIFLYALLSEFVFRFVSLMPHNLSVIIIKMLDINGDESLAITANANL
ncbi:hypothetical protein V2J09_003733 [Rumex salicifolius]